MTAAPARDCGLCPRLVGFRKDNQKNHPAYFNGAVPSFGKTDAWLLIVGLAPGLHGANQTGRPFTGDYAGELLYPTLLANGFARGTYAARADDGVELTGCRITNAVRCVPPENKPTPAEQTTCRDFLAGEMAGMTKLRAILALGRIAHDAVLSTLKLRKVTFPFGHGARHHVGENLTLTDSYHCSRYNVNTGVLTAAMFNKVVADVKALGRG